MGDELEIIEDLEVIGNKFCGILRLQDYAEECFALSRSDEEPFTANVEKAWLGDLSKYIVELETKVKHFASLEDSDE